MARVFYLAGDSIKIDKGFDTGGLGVFVNNRLGWEGALEVGQQVVFTVGSRDYLLGRLPPPQGQKAGHYLIRIGENGEEIAAQQFSELRKKSEKQQQAEKGPVYVCAAVFSMIGVAAMLLLNMTTGVIPGGAVGGAIGAAVGYGFGQLVGTAIFGKE